MKRTLGFLASSPAAACVKQAMVAISYLDPEEPKRLMARLRRLFNRARPTQTELDVLRGISAAIIESRSERAGRKKFRSGP